MKKEEGRTKKEEKKRTKEKEEGGEVGVGEREREEGDGELGDLGKVVLKSLCPLPTWTDSYYTLCLYVVSLI